MNKKSTAVERRKLIFASIRGKGEIALKDLLREFRGVKRQSLHDDISFLNQLGLQITTTKRGRETYFVDTSEPSFGSRKERSKHNSKAKAAIADMALELTVGYGFACRYKTQTLGQRDSGDDRAQRSFEDIINAFDKCYKPARRHWEEQVRPKLFDFWKEGNRSIALDSGSTSEHFAELLKGIQAPNDDSLLNILAVCTNSRSIFDVLGDPVVPIRTIMVGGTQIRGTQTVAGRFAEIFLEVATVWQFGIAFIGASMVDVENMKCSAPLDEECAIKNLFFKKSGLRVILADSSKFRRNPMNLGYHFSAITPNQIDLIITNDPVHLDTPDDTSTEALEMHQRRLEEFPKMVREIEERGVPILVANVETFRRSEEAHP